MFLSQNSLAEENLNTKKWIPIFQGVDYLLLKESKAHGQLRIHALRIDLNNQNISLFEVTQKSKIKASEFLETFDAQVAISGPESSQEGLQFFDSETNLQSFVDMILEFPADFEGVKFESAKPFKNLKVLVENGAVINYRNEERLARSAVGLSEDKKSLFFVIVEGGPRHGFFFKDLISIGALPEEFSQILIELGIFKAVQFNTNRFPTLSVREQKTQKLSLAIDYRDDGEMAMSSHLGLKALPLLESSQTFLDGIVEAKEELIKLRNRLREYGAADAIHFDEICRDFRREALIAEDKTTLSLKDLRQVDIKYTGAANDDVFRDANELVWIVKSGFSNIKPVHEYIGGQILHYFYSDQTPLLKIVSNEETLPCHELMIASRQIIGFEPESLRKPPSDQTLYGLADLKVAMDWIGLGDRHEGKQGYILKNGKYVAARIDFNNSFDESKGFFDWTHPDLDMSKQLLKNIEQFSFAELELAIQRLVSIPDDVLVNAVKSFCNDLYEFEKIDYCSQEPFMSSENIAKVLNSRKNAARNFDLGIQYFVREFGKEQKTKTHVIKIDVKKKTIRTMPTLNFDNPETTFEIAQRTHAVAAINGGFWNYGNMGGFTNRWVPNKVKSAFIDYLGIHTAYRKIGSFYSAHPEGSFKSVSPKHHRLDYGATTLGWNSLDEIILLDSSSNFFLGQDEMESDEAQTSNVSKAAADASAFSRMESALSVHPILILDGKAQKNLNANKSLRGDQSIPRTGICMHKSGDWNLVVSEAASLDFFVEIMQKLNCKSAFNLDGSGSSSLVFKAKEIYSGNKVAVVGLPTPRHVSDAIIVLDKVASDLKDSETITQKN